MVCGTTPMIALARLAFRPTRAFAVSSAAAAREAAAAGRKPSPMPWMVRLAPPSAIFVVGVTEWKAITYSKVKVPSA